MDYFVYIVECRDKTLYTGITTDIKARVIEHNSGEHGAKYTRVRRPVKLRYSESCTSKGAALSREYVIKLLSREKKLALIKSVK